MESGVSLNKENPGQEKEVSVRIYEIVSGQGLTNICQILTRTGNFSRTWEKMVEIDDSESSQVYLNYQPQDASVPTV